MWNFTDDKESSFDPIPPGVYNVVVAESEETSTKTFDKRLKMTLTVTDGDFAGRKIFDSMMLTGNEKAVQIGRGRIKSLLKCGGKSLDIKGPADLIGIEVAASVKIQKGTDGYDDRNSISSFKPKSQAVATTANPF